MMKRKITIERRLIGIMLFCVATFGCSRLQIAYTVLDWYIPYYVGTYVDLSYDQDTYLAREVDKLLAWHCRTHHSVYADLIRSVNDEYQTRSITRERLDDYLAQLGDLWGDIMRHASPAIAQLLETATQEQVNELFGKFADENEEWLTAFTKKTTRDVLKEYQDNMIEQLERWFGELRPDQLGAVRARMEYNMQTTIDLIYQVSMLLTDDQLRHLARQTAWIARDLDAFSCPH